MFPFWMILIMVFGQTPPADSDTADQTARIVRRLCDAAFAPHPDRFDLLVYKEVQIQQKSRQELRALAERAARELAGGEAGTDIKQEREAEIEANVENWMQEQTVPRRFIQRIRQDGEHQRIEITALELGQSISDARLSDSYVSLGKDRTVEGYSAFQVSGAGRFVGILKKGAKFTDRYTQVDRWLRPASMPNLAMFFATPVSGKPVASDQRIEALLAGGNATTIRVNSVNDVRAEGTLQLVEFIDNLTARVSLSLLVDPADYRRVYEVQGHEIGGNETTGILKRGGFLPNGVASEIEANSYYADGRLIEGIRVLILYYDFSPVFADDFRFRVPSGYGLSDARESPTRIVRSPDASAPEDGETVKMILAKGVGSVVTSNLECLGLGAPILASPTSGPAD